MRKLSSLFFLLFLFQNFLLAQEKESSFRTGKQYTTAMALSSIFGLGIGQFIIQDNNGGAGFLVLDLFSIGTIATSVALLKRMDSSTPELKKLSQRDMNKGYYAVLGVGCSSLFLSRIFQLILFDYTYKKILYLRNQGSGEAYGKSRIRHNLSLIEKFPILQASYNSSLRLDVSFQKQI